MNKKEIDKEYQKIMNCEDWHEIVDSIPVAAMLLGREAGFDEKTQMKLAIIEQHKQLKKLRERLGINASGSKKSNKIKTYTVQKGDKTLRGIPEKTLKLLKSGEMDFDQLYKFANQSRH